jgi:hypothetical protein
MNDNSRTSERLWRLLSGLKDAANRFNQSRTKPDPANSFAALAEALDWITKLDSSLDKLFPSRYEVMRGQLSPNILGLRLARNLGHHNVKTVDLVDLTRGVCYPVRPPVCPFELRWKIRKDLPDPDKHDVKFVRPYDSHVAGRLVRETLDEVWAFFDDVLKGHIKFGRQHSAKWLATEEQLSSLAE